MEGQNQNDELYPIAVLIDELKVDGLILFLTQWLLMRTAA